MLLEAADIAGFLFAGFWRFAQELGAEVSTKFPGMVDSQIPVHRIQIVWQIPYAV